MTVQTLAIPNASEDCYIQTSNGVINSSGLTQGLGSLLGLRWTGVSIPQGATITSATLILKVRLGGGEGGTNWGNILGSALDNAPAFSAGADWTTNHGSRKTPVQWINSNGATLNHDVTAIVQEIVNRPGWAAGNAMRFIGEAGVANGFGIYADIDNSAYATPLIISFVPPPSNGGSTGRGGALRSRWLRKPGGQGNVSLMVPRTTESTVRRTAMNWMLDRLVYRGIGPMAKAYLGTRTEAGLYLGERELF